MIDRLLDALSRWPIAPFAVPFLVVLPVWHSNRLRLLPGDAAPTLLVLLALVGLVMLALRLAGTTWRKAALIATIAGFFLLHTPALAAIVAETAWMQWAFIAVTGLVAFDIARRIPSEGENLAKATKFTNLAAIFLLLPLLMLAIYYIAVLEQGRPDPHDTFAPFEGQAADDSPDVWHIVMDRYPNTDTLARIYDIDNAAFLAALRERGFAVNERAHSNYQLTNLSLASTLNADHLDRFGETVRDKADGVPLFHAVRSNRAAEFFAANGYRTIFASTWAYITSEMDNIDREVNFRPMSEVPRIVIENSVPGKLAALFLLPYSSGRHDQCLREKSKFAELREIAEDPGRKYVFAHFLVPHPPFAFDPDGNCQSEAQELGRSRSENFRLQIAYANGELIRLIDRIILGPRPAVILLHADEGPYPAALARDELDRGGSQASFDEWKSGGADVWREKLGILMAVRNVGGKPVTAPSTPVNLYPMVINEHFGGSLPMREERSSFRFDETDQYDFTDVTGQLGGAARARR